MRLLDFCAIITQRSVRHLTAHFVILSVAGVIINATFDRGINSPMRVFYLLRYGNPPITSPMWCLTPSYTFGSRRLRRAKYTAIPNARPASSAIVT